MSVSGFCCYQQARLACCVAPVGHHDRGYGPGYAEMVTEYRLTARDVVTNLNTNSDMVSARVLAYEITGTVQTYQFTYQVRAGKIMWGRSVLLGTSHS
jgi:hypothetical protein